MKKGLLFGSLMVAAIAVGLVVNNSSSEHVKDYQPRLEANKKEAYSLKEQRYQYYGALLGRDGIIDPQDRINALEDMRRYSYSAGKSQSLTFVERGPDNIGGRTRAIGFDRSNDAVMYAGAIAGGLFKSTDAGNNWTRVQAWDDQIGALSISSIETTSDGTLYVATGPAQFEGGLTSGGSGVQNGYDGVYYSTDDGDNWTQLPGTSGSIMQIWRDPSQADKIYIGGTTIQVSPNKATGASTIASPVTGNGYDIKVSGDGSVVFICARVGGSFRYFVSTDFGSSFTQIASGLPTAIGRSECTVTDTKNGSGFYNIYVSASTGGGSLNSISLSEDHGSTWTNIGPGGSTLFQPYSTSLSSQGNYDQTIIYIPNKPDECIIGGIDQYHWAKDPGSSPTWGGWTQISLWSAFPTSPTYIHADNHEQKWNSAGQYYYGNDGGVGSAFGVPPGAIFYPANKGYNVTQFYSVAHDRFGHVMGGTQDNGTLYNDYSLSSALQFQEVYGGDGFDCDISHYDSDAMIATIYSSSIARSEDGGTNWQDISPPCSGAIAGQTCGVFHTPTRLFEDPNDFDSQDFIEYFASDSTLPSGTVITYYSKTYNSSIPENVLTHTLTSDLYYTDTLISVDTASNGDFFALHPGTSDTVWMGTDSLKLNYPYDTLQLQDPVQSIMVTLDAAGLAMTRDALRFGQSPDWWDLMDATGAGAFTGTPYCFEFSWDGDVMFCGTSNGVWRFQGLDSVYDSGDMSLIIASKIYSASGPVNGIAIDKNDPERLIVARAGVSGTTGLVELNNVITGSVTTTNIQGNISSAMAILDVVIDYRDPQKIFAATDFGVWATSDGGSNWTQNINETGPVPVFAIRQQQRGWQESAKAGEIYIGTHGRGIWTSGSVLSDGDVDHIVFDDKFESGLTVFPNPLDENGKVSFNLNTRADITLNIFSINGKLVKTIKKSNLGEGKQTVELDMNGTGKGTYIIQLVAGNYKDVTRFIKLK
jgi:hypothetical protein